MNWRNLEKWRWWTYLQGRSRDADGEIGFVDTVGEREGRTNGESSIETYTLLYVKQIANGELLYYRELNLMLCDNLEGWDGVGGGMEF